MNFPYDKYIGGSEMHVSIRPVLHTVAATKYVSAGAPSDLASLKELIEGVLGRRSMGPLVPDFLTDCIMTGLIAVRQHPILSEIQFRSSIAPGGVYTQWLNTELQRLNLGHTLSVRRADRTTIDKLHYEAESIVQETLRRALQAYG